MSGFTALNLEPEDNIEEETDDTKEIQIEEALKQYQVALKLHSQGPNYYDAARDAYDDLFKSEVFKYPEVVSDYNEEQVDEALGVGSLPIEQEPVPLTSGGAADSAANSLPQLIYLAYKSRAQFVLDLAHHGLQNASLDRRQLCQYYYAFCLKSLQDSASALERDDSDLDLWKKAARISDVLVSQRLARFCLESVLAGDDETGEQAVDLSGLDEAFASGELEQVLKLIGDDVSCLRDEPSRPKTKLLRMLQVSNDAYSYLPQRSTSLEYLDDRRKPNTFSCGYIELLPSDVSRSALGEAILNALRNYGSMEDCKQIGSFVKLVLPHTDGSIEASNVHNKTSFESATSTVATPHDVVAETTNGFPEGSMKSPASFHSAADEIQPEGEATVDDVSSKPDETATIPNPEPSSDQVGDKVASQNTLDEPRTSNRKRSSTAAGIEEHESRTKSKRLRARESMLELAAHDEDPAIEINQYNNELLAIIEDADGQSFDFVNKLLSQLDIQTLEPLSAIKSTFWREQNLNSVGMVPRTSRGTELVLTDMRHCLLSWNDEKSSAVISGQGRADTTEKSSGLALFSRHLRPNDAIEMEASTSAIDDHMLGSLIQNLSQDSVTMYDAIFIWLTSLVTASESAELSPSPYMTERWSDGLKQCVRSVSVEADEQIYYAVQSLMAQLKLEPYDTLNQNSRQSSSLQIVEFVQTMFEIHLDVYTSYSTPDTHAESTTKLEQHDRLHRWAQLSTDCMQAYFVSEPQVQTVDTLVLRFIWTSTKVASYTSGDDKSHVLLCLEDLRNLLVSAGSPTITLPNSTTMPRISVAAVEQESSRLATLDFFMSIFDTDNNDPVAIIMKLEPILEFETLISEDTIPHSTENSSMPGSQNEQLRDFLESGDASLKLFLWRRLQNAYTAISYPPKVVSCMLRSFEILVRDLQTERHASLEAEERQMRMLRWLFEADSWVQKVLNKVTEDSKAFESLDERHLVSSTEAVVSMLVVLQGFVMFDDSIRVGQTPLPSLRPSSLKSFDKSRDKFRDAYVRLWTLLFYLLKEASIQRSECFTRPADQLAEYLRTVHNALGYRQYCKHCNKMFVKLAKNELLALKSHIDYSPDLTQILYDMYQIKFGTGIGDADHGCVPDLLRDKTTAMTLVPIMMAYAKRLNVRDLIKSELKGTIEKIQQCIGPVRSSSALTFNRKAVSSFLKSPINPQAVYRSLNGIGDLTTKSVFGDHAKIAALGWYLLLGKLSLAKFKSIKRVNPTATDDLDVAAGYLRHDLEHNALVNWESWYRLAQVYDAKIEDSLIWNAAKLNDSRGEIAILERNAINAYTMAVTMAMRGADDTPETVQNISDMFSEFAFRLYASSRPPLDMVAFETDKSMRHISNSFDQTMSKAPFIPPFRPYSVWSFATYLLRRKFKASSREWYCQYMLGKCLWKMYQSNDNASARQPVVVEDVFEAFVDAIALVPMKEKSSDYILEPHYKLASIVHKLVHRKILDARKGIEYLRGTPFAKGARLSEDEQGQIEWEPYILDVLGRIGRADKSNWHHRITARAAHVIYDDDPNVAGALGAKHQFTQQIFTKTMTMQVWKPEHERPGRHYVYTGRYLSFFVHLLEQLTDRENMEQLVRRIRRKTTDFLDHPKVWEQTATTYLRLLRRVAKIPEGRERAVFDKITYDDFSRVSEKIEQWAHKQDSSSLYLSTISDAIELKKLNNSLMKGPAIDDLIGDTYACMYEAVSSQFPPEEPAPRPGPLTSQATFINMTTDTTSTPDSNLDRMRLNNLLSVQADGELIAPNMAASGSSTGFQAHSRATPPVDPSRMPTPTKPGRPKTITKREIQRKAEAAISKLQPIKTPTLNKKLIVDIPSIKRPRGFSNNAPPPEEEGVPEDAPKDEDNVASDLNSRRPSVAGSNRNSDGGPAAGEDDNENEADDESDMLSEVQYTDGEDESHSRRPSLFPGDGEVEIEMGGDDDGEDDEAGSDGDEEDNNDGQDDEADGVGDGDGDEDEAEGSDNENGPEVEDTMDVDEGNDNDDAMEIQDSQDQEHEQSKAVRSDAE